MANLELLIGLVAIAVAVFFGLRGFGKSITSELRTIKETVIALRTTAERTWDLIVVRFAPGTGTVERELENLGKVKITAEPGKDETSYLIEIEKPTLLGGWIDKLSKETGLAEKERQMFGKEPAIVALSRTRLRMVVPSTDPISCTEYISLFLKWLNSTYVESLKEIKGFEEPILT